MQKRIQAVAACALVGTTTIACMYVWRYGKVITKLVEQNNMKAELINWITQEGLDMDRSQFVDEFMVKAQFINMSLHM